MYKQKSIKKKKISSGFVALVFLMSINALITCISVSIIQTETGLDNGELYHINNPATGWVENHHDKPTGKKFMLYEKSGGGFWADAEKSPLDDGGGNPGPNNPGDEDDLLCWAATASNMLEWTGWGFVGGMKYGSSDDFFQYYQDHVTDRGSRTRYGLDWWFDGTIKSHGSKWAKEDVKHSGFWKNYKPSKYISYYTKDSSLLPNIRKSFEQHCAVGLSIDQINGDGRHAITCWGFNYNPHLDPIKNKKDYYLGVWVTDSDSHKSSSSPDDVLRYYKLEYNDNKDYWYMPNYGNGWRITVVTSLKMFPGSYLHPVAKIAVDYKKNNFFIFDAGKSGNWGGPELMYRWDFDGDGNWDTKWLNNPKIWHMYSKNAPYVERVYLEVFDGRLRDIDSMVVVTQAIIPGPPPV